MCVVCWGYTTHVERGKKENFCMCDRFSADGFRTRAVRVIRRRVLGVRAAKGKNRERERERGNVQVIPGRGKRVCVCRCALCVRRAGTRGPFHAPPQLKPRYEVKSGKEGVRVPERDAETQCVRGGKRNITGITKRSNWSAQGALHPCDRRQVMWTRCCCM